jgi:transmembrane sensor
MRLVRDGNGELLISHGVEMHQYLGWLENRLQFEDTPLTQVIKKLERWYKVDIILKDSELSDLRFTGTFKEESLFEILNSMEYTLQLEVEIDDRTVTLFREGTYGNNNQKRGIQDEV